MYRTVLISTIITSASGFALAKDFGGKQFDFGEIVSAGTLLDCETLSAGALKQRAPKAFNWAMAQGLVELSAVTGTASYTAKVTTKMGSERVLMVGCWVTSEVVKENVNGRQNAFAKGTFQINDTLRSSPFAETAICKKKRQGAPLYVQGDYRFLYEKDVRDCKPDAWKDTLPSLATMESESALFALRESIGKKGYVREVGF